MTEPNFDTILATFNRHHVCYLVIGGLNFALRHEGGLTQDVDFWIEDTDKNRTACHAALSELNAEVCVGEDWSAVSELAPTWLERRGVYCLVSPAGDIDIFRSVTGLGEWDESNRRAVVGETASGIEVRMVDDYDLLACQLALPEAQQKLDRVRTLRESVNEQTNGED